MLRSGRRVAPIVHEPAGRRRRRHRAGPVSRVVHPDNARVGQPGEELGLLLGNVALLPAVYGGDLLTFVVLLSALRFFCFFLCFCNDYT